MDRLKHDLLLRIVKGLAVVLVTIPFAVCWYVYYAERIYIPFYNKGNWLIIALFVVLYVALARNYDAFLISINRISEMVYSQGLAALIADCILFAVTCLLTRHMPNPLPVAVMLAGQVLVAAIWSVLAYKWYYATFPPVPSAVVYDDDYEIEKLIREYGLERKCDAETRI